MIHCAFIVLIKICFLGLQKVKKTGSDGTELQEIALETFLCTEEDKADQELEIFGKRFVVFTC